MGDGGATAAGVPERAKIPIETLVRSVAIVGALFYVLGFLTNAYFYKLGVSNFSLLRTRFILTGVLTLAGATRPGTYRRNLRGA